MRKIILILFLAITLCSCQSKDKNNVANVQNRANAIVKDGTSKVYKRKSPYANDDPINTPKEVDEVNNSTEDRAELIARNLTTIKGISNASVVLTGKSAIVGIEIDGQLDDAKLIRLKREAEREVRVTDKHIKNVAVTAAEDLVKRITTIADFATKQDSNVDISEEAGEIIQQLTPTV